LVQAAPIVAKRGILDLMMSSARARRLWLLGGRARIFASNLPTL
jgi:hypothetical protein